MLSLVRTRVWLPTLGRLWQTCSDREWALGLGAVTIGYTVGPVEEQNLFDALISEAFGQSP